MPPSLMPVLSLCLAVPAASAAAPAADPVPFVIIAPRDPDYWSTRRRLELAGRPLLELPASATIIPRALLDDQGARGISGAAGNDTSLGENYAPLGYYETLSMRGFTLDNASAYKRDGLTIVNESSIPLENKERVEFLKGVAGLEAGLASPGGVVNYITKRPPDAPVRRITLEMGGHGTKYAHADLGGRAGRFGWRFNAARESIRPYVKEATGRRDFLGAALDWRLNESTTLGIDADWQKKSQLSVPGYQPLDGTALPPDVRPEKMLNDQPWSEPVVIESHALGARIVHDGSSDWRLDAAVSLSRAAAEDKAAFPYGCSSGPAYSTTFCGNGDYDLYDYRSSGEVRGATHAQAVLSARRDWGAANHEAALGLSRFERTVDLGQEVYAFVGTGNIHDPRPRIFAPSPLQPGPVHRVQDYEELAVFARDTMTLGSRWKVHAGLRANGVADDRFRKTDGAPVSRYRRSFLSPQLALSVAPRPDILAYAAYGQGLELGGTAGVATANAGQTLDPKVTRQVELGVKHEHSRRLLAAVAAFHAWKPYEFVDPANTFVQKGTVGHSGLEFSALGRLRDDLRIFGSAALTRARQGGTGVSAFDGKAPPNVPWLRAQATLDWALPRAPDAALNGSWAYAGRRSARRNGALSVPAHHRLDLGARWTPRIGPCRLTWRVRVENALDAVYWKDVGEYFGDGYLHLGAPRTYRLSAQLDF